MGKKYIMAIPQTSLRLFEVEVQDNITPEQALDIFKGNHPGESHRIKPDFIGICKVGEYQAKATLMSEVPQDSKLF